MGAHKYTGGYFLQKVRKSGVGVRQIPQWPRVWVLGFAQEGERSGGNTLYALVAGEGTDEDLDTWRGRRRR